MDRYLELGMSFFTSPETNALAMGFIGFLVLMVAWKFVPMLLVSIPALDSDEAGARFMRGLLSFGVSVVLALLAARLVATLPHS